MGVYIKGMKMPERGEHHLILYVFADGSAQVDGSYRIYNGEPFEAIPVPDHGRLVDADALMENAQYKGTHDILTAWDIVAAPTIIPADKEGGK